MNINKKAFTLVELIVVVTILAVLATIGFVSYSGYLVGTRDTNRISNLKAVFDGLEMYRTKHDLPIPEDNVEIKSNGVTIARQGYAGTNVLETIEFSNGGKDPRDNNYYSYYLSRDRKYLQLMGFLEDSSNSPEKPVLSTSQERYPVVYGDKLGILTGTGSDINVPIQDISSIKSAGELDIVTTTTPYNSHMRDNQVASGTGSVLFELEEIASVGGKFCGASSTSLYCLATPLFSENLIGYWDFEAGYTDKSNTNNTALAGGSVISNAIANSTRNNYASFDGVSDCMEIPDSPEYQLDSGTISFFVKQNNYSTTQGLFSRDANGTAYPGHFSIRSNTGTTDYWVRLQESPGDHTISPSVTGVVKTDWNNIVVSFGSNGINYYENGVFVTTNSYAGGIAGNNNPIGVGCLTWSTLDDNMDSNLENFLNGYMDNIIIYNRQLNASEILELYNSQK